MEQYDLPEMLTAPLEKLYLQTKHLGYKLAKSFSPAATASISEGLDVRMKFTSSELLQMTVQVRDSHPLSTVDHSRRLMIILDFYFNIQSVDISKLFQK